MSDNRFSAYQKNYFTFAFKIYKIKDDANNGKAGGMPESNGKFIVREPDDD
jgi:hypothetical protein